MTEINKNAFDAMERGNDPKIEKLVAIVVKPNLNNWAEFFKDVSIGFSALAVLVFLILGVITK